MHRHPGRMLVAAALLGAAFGAPGAAAAELERGRALYEGRCLGCHGESVHSREKRTASDFASIRRWVVRWNEALGARWDADDVDEVTVYLNTTYYKYPCPPSACKVVSLMDINSGEGIPPYLGKR